ncbi:helix-turn-helix domain-containing protein [Streptomyces sp. NPDC049577]|uniref:helix-turn-helix domain-containing protein n=1 Tax=Streptomyces sp. NPDC049577 TaxID=3155153 RepID=UPI00342006F0
MSRYATREQIVQLLREGLSNHAIARELGCDRHRVGALRHELGIAPVPLQPLTLEQKWEARTRPVEGGHLEWTGERQSTSGTPVLRYRERSYSPAAIAFRIQHGREPEGYVRADCGFKHCVAPGHVDDMSARLRTREQLRYLTGHAQRPAVCAHGHDQAKQGRYEADGRAYCEACKAHQRKAGRKS